MTQHEVPVELREDFRSAIAKVLALNRSIQEKQAELYQQNEDLKTARAVLDLALRMVCHSMQIDVKPYKFREDGSCLMEE